MKEKRWLKHGFNHLLFYKTLFAVAKSYLHLRLGATSLGEAHIICRRQHHYGKAVHHLRPRRNIIAAKPQLHLKTPRVFTFSS
jgi:hypothetical protein